MFNTLHDKEKGEFLLTCYSSYKMLSHLFSFIVLLILIVRFGLSGINSCLSHNSAKLWMVMEINYPYNHGGFLLRETKMNWQALSICQAHLI